MQLKHQLQYTLFTEHVKYKKWIKVQMDLLILDVQTLVFCFNFLKILSFQTQFWTDCTERKLNCTNILLENFWLPTCRWGCNLLGDFSFCDDSFPPPHWNKSDELSCNCTICKHWWIWHVSWFLWRLCCENHPLI